jgi:CBS domain-containing protein
LLNATFGGKSSASCHGHAPTHASDRRTALIKVKSPENRRSKFCFGVQAFGVGWQSGRSPEIPQIQGCESFMFDRPVKEMMRREKVLKAPPETPVSKAAKLMVSKSVGAVMVIEDDCLVGICTERDIVFRVVAKGLDARATRLADVMTMCPQTIAPEKPFGYALLLMHERGFRHLPVVQAGKVVGMVSSRSALDPSLEEFVSEEQRRKHFEEKG